jgi:hypothetical protein
MASHGAPRRASPAYPQHDPIHCVASSNQRVTNNQLPFTMPPKAKATASTGRGRGRPARTAAPETAAPTTTTATPKKRGRPAKADAADAAVEPPKKRGRPAASEAVEPPKKRGRPPRTTAAEAVEPVAAPARRAGRPRTQVAAVEEAAAPKARGRPRKSDIVPAASSAETPKRRGRPPKASAPAARASRVVKAAPRMNPKMRSRLRVRQAPVVEEREEAPAPGKRRRGPNKAVAEAAAPKKTVGRPRTSATAKAAPKAALKAAPKVAAPRKRRGYTTVEVPDKFVLLVKQLIKDQLAADEAIAAPPEEEIAEEEANEGDVESEGENESEAIAEDAEDQLDRDMGVPEDIQLSSARSGDSHISSARSEDDLELDVEKELGDTNDESPRSPYSDEEDAIGAIHKDLGAHDDDDSEHDFISAIDNTHNQLRDPFTDDEDMGTGDLRAGADLGFFAGPVGTETVTAVETESLLVREVV